MQHVRYIIVEYELKRHGLGAGDGQCMGPGVVGYGFVVNTDRLIDFGRLMGLYIVVFFVVSQAVAFWAGGERPSPSLWLGGALIVLGGLVIHVGRP